MKVTIEYYIQTKKILYDILSKFMGNKMKT